MGARLFLASRTLLIAALPACGGTTGPGAASDAGGGAGGAAPSIAQSAVVREPASGVSATALGNAIAANNAFAVDLYAHIRASAPAGNLLTSPLSASFALTMTYAGAAGVTATQMASALHLGDDPGSIFDGQNALSQTLAGRAGEALNNDTQAASGGDGSPPSPSDYELQVVNSVWGQKAYPWEPSFLDLLARSYGTGVYLEDFKTQPDPARLAINAWVDSQTAGKIANLLPSGSIDVYTRMVLVNAIHLKLPWATAFPASATVPGSFTTGSGMTVSAPMMNQALSYAYEDDGQAQIVSLPLSGGYMRVVIALPHGDLATYENGLSATSPAFQPSGEALVTLTLPKLTFTSPTFSLSQALKAMGMTQAFDQVAADFTGMCAHPPDGETLYVKDVLQKATLAMQETGVEAAAASAVIVGTTLSASPPEATATMVVNRPFLVAIVDLSGAILFLGHIDDPTVAGGP